MTVPTNLTKNSKGSHLSVAANGDLTVTIACTPHGRVIQMVVNTFDCPPKQDNCNDEYYINNKMQPGYVVEEK